MKTQKKKMRFDVVEVLPKMGIVNSSIKIGTFKVYENRYKHEIKIMQTQIY